jgi:hypothetical protein
LHFEKNMEEKWWLPAYRAARTLRYLCSLFMIKTTLKFQLKLVLTFTNI